MEKRQSRYQVLVVEGDNGALADQIITNFLRLDSGFNRITGISVVQVKDGGIPLDYSLALRDDRRTWVDAVNIQNLLANSNVSPNDKYLEVDIPFADGAKFSGDITPNANLTGDLKVEITLRLVSDLVEINK